MTDKPNLYPLSGPYPAIAGYSRIFSYSTPGAKWPPLAGLVPIWARAHFSRFDPKSLTLAASTPPRLERTIVELKDESSRAPGRLHDTVLSV